MGVFYTLEIAPKSNTLTKLEDIISFISSLVQDGHIDTEFTVLTGDINAIRNVSYSDFKDRSISSELIKNSKLEILKDKNFDNLSSTNNYAFKIHVKKTSKLFENLEIFQATEQEDYPMFISYFGNAIDFTIMNQIEDDYEEILISNINCFIKSDGRNLYSLGGLIEDQEDFSAFFEYVKQLFGEYKTGAYCD